MATQTLQDCTTITSFKPYEKKLDISYAKTFLKTVIPSDDTKLIVNHTSLPNKYFDYISDIVTSVTMTDEEYIKYRYQPKLFCYNYYGTTELWALLLKVNNMTSAIEFNKKNIKVFSQEIFSLLNEIFILEKENITNDGILIRDTENEG